MRYCPKCGAPNADNAATCVSCGQSLPPVAPGAPVEVKTSGLAIAAFVLGILSLFMLGLTALPAIIVGIIALAAIGRSGGRLTGRAFAILGIVLPVVSIFFVALLMAILMPALSRARMQARNVMCQSNLRQWSVIWAMYTDDNNGRFNVCDNNRGSWMEALNPFYAAAEEIRLCPLATKVANPEMTPGVDPWGKTFVGWGKVAPVVAGIARPEGYWGSYGINGYVYVPGPKLTCKPPDRFWKTTGVRGASDIPLLLDCSLWCGWPDSDDTPPQYDGWEDRDDQNAMNRFCLNRHQEQISAAFLDCSVRRVGLKELWTLNWHKGYDRAGSWTAAGGVQPNDWPQWMRGMKDY